MISKTREDVERIKNCKTDLEFFSLKKFFKMKKRKSDFCRNGVSNMPNFLN